ncbi:unnamed protein product [Meloidogyne enterolobii]|uniref:Uncharacterized protein n=1 Tax=Meloidogyne enterolobii TaxID=390850 RepID=A0ACB0YG94_MELEN
MYYTIFTQTRKLMHTQKYNKRIYYRITYVLYNLLYLSTISTVFLVFIPSHPIRSKTLSPFLPTKPHFQPFQPPFHSFPCLILCRLFYGQKSLQI